MSNSKIRQWNAEELTHPELGELPSDWKWSTIGNEITELKGGLGTKKSDYIDSGVLLFNKGNVTTYGRTSFEGKRKYVSAKFFTDHKKHAVEPGNLVVTLRDLSEKADFLGLVGTYRQAEPALLSQGACVVETGSRLHAPYLAYYSNSPFYRTTAKANKNGTTQVHLRNGQFGAIPIPLPPLSEQRRIVARIEELFSRLDAGVAALRHAKAQLQRYRQSVLAAAATGQLTQAWREQNPDTEPAEELLERILEQRREQWNGRGKYKEPKGIDAEDFKPLPEGWVWSSGEQHFDWSSGKGLTKKEQQPGEVPVIGGNGVLGTHSEANVMTPTLVVGRVGAQCGNVYRTSAPAWITDNAIYATFVPEAICLPFIEMAFRAANLNSRAGGSGQPFVNQGTLNELEIALPPLAEQLRIVDEVEARTTAIDHLEAELDRQITRTNRLRQSTLASAFDGRL